VRIENNQNVNFKARVRIIPIAKGSENNPLLTPLVNKLKRIGGKNIEHIIETYNHGTKFTTKYPAETGDVRIKLNRSLFIDSLKREPLTAAGADKIIQFSNGMKNWIERIENNKHLVGYPKWKQVFEESKTEFIK